MKRFILVPFLLVFLTGCEMMLGNYITNTMQYNRIAVVSEIDQCNLVGNLTTKTTPFRDRRKNAFMGGIRTLKWYMGAEGIKGNALFNIRMDDPEYPIANADVYKCPDEVFKKFKPLQNDQAFIFSQIKFDLKLDETKK